MEKMFDYLQNSLFICKQNLKRLMLEVVGLFLLLKWFIARAL